MGQDSDATPGGATTAKTDATADARPGSAAPSDAPAATYTLTFRNDSTRQGSFVIYQRLPEVNQPDVMSLAWLVKPTPPGVSDTFTWSADYSFFWSSVPSASEPLTGVKVEASEAVPAGLRQLNQIRLHRADGAFMFMDQATGQPPGALIIEADGTVPEREALMGIGMSGLGTAVVRAEPNMRVVFTPRPGYFVTFGTFQQGEVLDLASLVGAHEVAFPDNVTNAMVTLDDRNGLTVAYA
ncbi:protein rhiA [Breoghania sp. L-A4]|uniref:protein rhiA n=1 Tax=Breoghania sp. L-A4 TaxID=2304600 RepID=UPI000E35F4DD|nr:protein rhiA [Breoghania sp. L-A4]AXS41073.1 protein rhiA [Breoghania sp. L-A4]